MPWWEGKLIAELQKLPPAEIEQIVGAAIVELDHDRFMAFMRAIKRDAQRRGLLTERQPA